MTFRFSGKNKFRRIGLGASRRSTYYVQYTIAVLVNRNLKKLKSCTWRGGVRLAEPYVWCTSHKCLIVETFTTTPRACRGGRFGGSELPLVDNRSQVSNS